MKERKALGGSVGVLLFFILAGATVLLVPEIDLRVSALFYDPKAHFFLKDRWGCILVYRLVEAFAAFLAVGLPLCLAGTLVRKKPVFSLSRYKLMYLLLVLALGPGLVVNGIFKAHWGRARPDQIDRFGGQKHFTPAWVISKECRRNCAFASGHASMGFYLFAFAFLSPRNRRKWMAAALICGFTVGMVRIVQGSHFVSDVVFSGMMVYLVAWAVRGLMALFVEGAHWEGRPVARR